MTRLPCDSPNVQSWSCAECGTQWAVTEVNPHPYPFLRQLAEEVAERSLLRRVEELRAEAAGLSEGQLRARLIMLLAALDQHVKAWPG